MTAVARTITTTVPRISRYNSESARDWGRDRLADRFLEYLGELVKALETKNLQHYWVKMNLLEGIERTTLKNMEDRLRRFSKNSKDSLTKILEPRAPGMYGGEGLGATLIPVGLWVANSSIVFYQSNSCVCIDTDGTN